MEKVRARARDAISKAERIYVIGFQFDPYNISAIGLQEINRDNRAYCLNFDGHLGLQQKMGRLGI